MKVCHFIKSNLNIKLSYRKQTAHKLGTQDVEGINLRDLEILRLGPLKVIGNGTIRKLWHDFLLVTIVTMAMSRIISEIQRDIA